MKLYLCVVNWINRIHYYFFPAKRAKTKEDPMKYLIVGLGNIGPEYDKTRHNVGFDVVDHIADQFKVSFKPVPQGQLTQFRHKGRTFILLKPSTYMNLSGKAIKYWMQKEKMQPENLLVIVDDMNLPLGKIRLRTKGSDGGHNGLKHIQLVLGHTQYARMRIGIGADFSKGRQVDFVLGKWTADEKPAIEKAIAAGAKGALNYATIGPSHAMNDLNV
jgi:PTH1 family peptidyl-tRNA hydrolase